MDEFDEKLYPPEFPGLRERVTDRLAALDAEGKLDGADGRALARVYTTQVLDDIVAKGPREDGSTTRWSADREHVVFISGDGEIKAVKTLDEVAYAAFPNAYPDGPPPSVEPAPEPNNLVPWDSLSERARDYIESRYNTVTGEVIDTPDAARACVEDLLDVMIGEGAQKDGRFYERTQDGRVRVFEANGVDVREVTVDAIARKLFPDVFAELSFEERMHDITERVRGRVPYGLPDKWDEITDRETAMTLAEGIVDDLVAYGPTPLEGENVDATFERGSRGRVFARSSSGKILHADTIEGIARKQFPKAFEVHPYDRWEDAMVEQTRLYEFSQSDLGRRYLGEYEKGMNEGHVPAARIPEGFLQMLQAHMLGEAEPCWIAPEVVDMIHHARDHESYRPEPVLGSDAFTPHGFCLLSRPLRLHDEPDSEQRFRAVGWYSVHGDDDHTGCFWISLYAHVEDGLVPHGIQVETPEWRRANAPLMLAHYFQWTWGAKPWEEGVTVLPSPGEEDDTESKRRAREQSATMQVLWRLSQQFVPVQHRAPRGLRRDTKRRLKRDLQTVNVIKLRRERSVGEHEETDRHYSVSFLVHGYWAPRWCKEDPNQPPGGPMVKRQVWVRPHVKGQGPFKDTKRVWEFVR